MTNMQCHFTDTTHSSEQNRSLQAVDCSGTDNKTLNYNYNNNNNNNIIMAADRVCWRNLLPIVPQGTAGSKC